MDRDWKERGEKKRENKEEGRGRKREGEGRWGSRSKRERLEHRNR